MIVSPASRGSAALEAVICAPALLLLVGVIFAGGRAANAHQALQTAASDAARAASIARDARAAAMDGNAAATSSIRNQGIPCSDVTVDVDTRAFARPVGQPGMVQATVSCRLDLADLSVPGMPGSKMLTATVSSPLDTWRERS